MSTSGKAVCTGFFLLACGVALAGTRWVPVTARVRQTLDISTNGQITKHEVTEGYYYRSSDGSFLTKWTSQDGNEIFSGELFDNKSGIGYQLDYRFHRAFVYQRKPFAAVPPGIFGSQKLDAIGQDSVSGIPCTVIPVNLQLPGAAPQRVGTSCVSVEYDLQLRTEMTVPGDTETDRTVVEYYAVQINSEPDPKLFDVQGQFTIFSPQTPNKKHE